MSNRALSDDELIADLLEEEAERVETEKAWTLAHPNAFKLQIKSKSCTVVPFSLSGSWRVGVADGDE